MSSIAIGRRALAGTGGLAAGAKVPICNLTFEHVAVMVHGHILSFSTNGLTVDGEESSAYKWEAGGKTYNPWDSVLYIAEAFSEKNYKLLSNNCQDFVRKLVEQITQPVEDC